MPSDIKLDYQLSLAKFIGDEHGITPQELAELQPELQRVQTTIQSNRGQGGYSFMQLPSEKKLLAELKAYREQCTWVTDFVIFGIGGSDLGDQALYQTFCALSAYHGPTIHITGNVDPVEIDRIFAHLQLETTLFCIICKSGETLETMLKLPLIKQAYQAIGKDYKEHLVIVSNPHPVDVGGRFAVLSIVGLLPAVFMGIDIEQLLAGAASMDKRCHESALEDNPGLMYGAVQHLLCTKKNKTQLVMMPYAERLALWPHWFAQLWAESLGKKFDQDGKEVRRGQTPIKALGSIDQHSQTQLYNEGPHDKSLTFIKVDKFNSSLRINEHIEDMRGNDYLVGHTVENVMHYELEGTRYSLYHNRIPTQTITFPEISESTIGQFIYMMEYATATVGELWHINAFNQPGVELGKKVAYALLGQDGFDDLRAEIISFQKSLGQDQ
jgi:glucose-6-phosphate isomerase